MLAQYNGKIVVDHSSISLTTELLVNICMEVAELGNKALGTPSSLILFQPPKPLVAVSSKTSVFDVLRRASSHQSYAPPTIRINRLPVASVLKQYYWNTHTLMDKMAEAATLQ